jgi:signal recognition particle receptor subunit beta
MADRRESMREIDCKVVYVGPAGSGKSTTIRALHDQLAPDTLGPILAPTEPDGSTLFFDLLTIELGTLEGRSIRLQLLSAPGDPGRSEVRQTVLRGADGVIFVADSSPERMEANREALAALRADLELLGQAASMPVVFQHNKRDLPDAVSEDELNRAVNPQGAPAYATVATRRQGIVEAVTAVSEQVVRALA